MATKSSRSTPDKTMTATDHEGRTIEVGDIVRSLTGDITGTVKEIAREDGEDFVRIRPDYQPGGKGAWHSAYRVIFSKAGRKR